MADEDREKAEKLAAAKKRFEQLKKEQQKKGKKGNAKKKGEKSAGTSEKTEEDTAIEESSKDTEQPVNAPQEQDNEGAEGEDGSGIDDSNAKPDQEESSSAASKQRSGSFRQGATSIAATSEFKGPQGEVQELYRKQAERIEELETEAKTAATKNEEYSAKLAKAEQELERLRESNGDLAEWKSRAADAERVKSELASVQRQLAQAQQSTKSEKRRVSATGADVAQQLESKTTTIESLELELSNLRNQLKTLEGVVSEQRASTADAEQRAADATRATESYQKELEALKVSMTFPSDETTAANQDPEALTKRVALLESELRTAQSNGSAASQRATSLEQKVEALTKLHKDANSSSQLKDKELANLRNQLKQRERPSHVRDASEFELGEDETETGALQARIRALEAENFDLRRGVWREKRAELQPGMNDDGAAGSGEYEDIDLNGPYSPLGRRQPSMQGQQSSSFQDVIASGISAFTGRPREPPKQAHASPVHARKQSLGLLDDEDDAFDEEAFRLAQEEEAKKRIERVREVKRGLENWAGWRVDIAELRQSSSMTGAQNTGPVFEI